MARGALAGAGLAGNAGLSRRNPERQTWHEPAARRAQAPQPTRAGPGAKCDAGCATGGGADVVERGAGDWRQREAFVTNVRWGVQSIAVLEGRPLSCQSHAQALRRVIDAAQP